MSSQSPLIGVQHVDYRGRRFVLGRTADRYAIWDAETGGAPVETFDQSADGWAAAWRTYEEREGPGARAQQTTPAYMPSPTATWRRGQPLALQPMRVGQILDGAFRLYRMEFRTLVPLVALVVVPFEVLGLVLTLATLEPVVVGSGFQRVVVEQPALWVTVGTAVLQGLFVGPFLTAAVVRTASDAYLGQRTSVAASYGVALRRVHSILWVTFLGGVTVTLIFAPGILLIALGGGDGGGTNGFGMLLLLGAIVPGILLFLRWLFSPATVVLEDIRGTAAMRRSWRLAQGVTGKILGTMLLTWLILMALLFVFGMIFGLIFGLVLLSSGPDFASGGGVGAGFYALNHAINAVATVLVTPFPTLVTVLLYFDARIRKEGFDLEVMARQLGQAAPPGA